MSISDKTIKELNERETIGSFAYKIFKNKTDILCTENKKRVIKLIDMLNTNTFDIKKGFDGPLLESEMVPNTFIAFKCLVWLADNYANDPNANYMLEVMSYLHQSPEGRLEGKTMYAQKYTQDERRYMVKLRLDLCEEIYNESLSKGNGSISSDTITEDNVQEDDSLTSMYNSFKREIGKLCLENKVRALKLLNDLQLNTYDPRRGCEGVMFQSDILANPQIAYNYLTWLSQFYPNDPRANFMMEYGTYLANTEEGIKEEKYLYSIPYTGRQRVIIDLLISELKKEIDNKELLDALNK